jgi:hypothetical protein
MSHLSDAMQECIDRCQTCEASCLQSVSHCLTQGGKHADAKHIGLLAVCAEICHTSARFMLYDSTFHTRICAICAEVCDACAEDCERFADDDMMQQCAQACRRCADSCREMSRAVTSA